MERLSELWARLSEIGGKITSEMTDRGIDIATGRGKKILMCVAGKVLAALPGIIDECIKQNP